MLKHITEQKSFLSFSKLWSEGLSSVGEEKYRLYSQFSFIKESMMFARTEETLFLLKQPVSCSFISCLHILCYRSDSEKKQKKQCFSRRGCAVA